MRPDVTRARRRRFVVVASTACALFAIAACSWDPSRPFDREAPEVTHAVAALDAGDALAAASSLEDYLSTGSCRDGKIGTPLAVHARPHGTFDLGLALFQIGESYGHRFGDEEVDAGPAGEEPSAKEKRAHEVECALAVVQAIANDDDVPLDVRARARYLEGNLLFLSRRYEEAVAAYDKALVLAPGYPDGGDAVGRDAAWNRAIALRRIEDQKHKDAGSDASSGDGGGDGGGNDGGGDAGNDSGGGKNDAGNDGGGKNDKDKNDGGGGQDSGSDGGNDNQPPPQQNDAGAPPPPPQESQSSQDERMLDQLEKAPTVQQEAAKKAASQRRVRGMADK